AISTYEITNIQYVEFLNAVARGDDTYSVASRIADSSNGIGSFTDSDGIHTYYTPPSDANKAVNWVSFYDAIRFANWMHNGQPSGAQDSTTTEDGAYTITLQGINDNSITRNPGARFFAPSEDEWYKPAYYDPQSGTYFDYATGSDTPPTCTLPSAEPNRANSEQSVGGISAVGSYTGCPSADGTFDQNGNVMEWTETVIVTSRRVYRGGEWSGASTPPAWLREGTFPNGSSNNIGFRLGMPVPEPSTGLLVAFGMLGLSARRRTNA